MEIDNETFMILADLDYKYGEEIYSELDFIEERVLMLLTDVCDINTMTEELNISVEEIREIKESAINKIIDKFGRGN